jgi:DNA-binding transcriptional ArsR family regulator
VRRGLSMIASEGRTRTLTVDMPKRNGPGIELLADPTRRRILAEIALCPQRPSSLASTLGLSRPAISRQLRLLRSASLVSRQRAALDGRVWIYSIDRKMHGSITAWLAGTEIARPLRLELDDDGSLHRR